ncbi:MAG: hypothetical protein ABIF19_17665 [Planctomycetota bacterium]
MSDADTPWPDVRRSIFSMEGPAADSSTKCFIDHMGLFEFGASYIADQYKRAADQLVEMQKKGGDPYHPDGLFMPIGYLYRHAIELKLKGLLGKIIQCDLAKDENDALGGHGLIKLWDAIKPALVDQWPKADRKPLNNAEALIRDFHRIDKSGQSLRYSSTKNGSNVKNGFPKVVRLEMLQEAVSEMYNLLDGCEMHFDNILEYIAESRRDCAMDY